MTEFHSAGNSVESWLCCFVLVKFGFICVIFSAVENIIPQLVKTLFQRVLASVFTSTWDIDCSGDLTLPFWVAVFFPSAEPLVAQCTSPRLVIIYFVFVAAGVFCAIVSHPADTIVSKLNQQKGSSIAEVARKLGFMGEQRLITLYYWWLLRISISEAERWSCVVWQAQTRLCLLKVPIYCAGEPMVASQRVKTGASWYGEQEAKLSLG